MATARRIGYSILCGLVFAVSSRLFTGRFELSSMLPAIIAGSLLGYFFLRNYE